MKYVMVLFSGAAVAILLLISNATGAGFEVIGDLISVIVKNPLWILLLLPVLLAGHLVLERR